MKSKLKMADRLISVPLLYLLISGVLSYSYGFVGVLTGVAERPADVVVPQISYLFSFLVSLLAFYSLCRMDTLHHGEAMKRYAEKPSFHLTDRLSFLVKEYLYWCQLGLLALLHIVLPAKWTFLSFHMWRFGAGETLSTKWQGLAILLPLLLVLSFLGRLSAVKQWHRRKFAPMENGDKAYTRSVAVLVVAYLAGGAALLNLIVPLVYNYFFGFFAILSDYAITWVVILVAAFFGYRWLRAFLARRKFVRRITALTRREPVKISRPYRSVVSIREGMSDFTVQSKGKTYDCKLIACRNSFAPLYVGSDGIFHIVHQIRLRGVEFFRWETEGSFAFEGDGQKVLIINPVPRKVFGAHLDKTWPMDNGDKVGDYRVYTATAFLNALERECLDRMG